tara:strand:+ start:574 stop:900 length:327 start_codon:yes stop_codon:yes gene_type:complete
MRKTILTIATIGLLFTSCTKEDDLQPVVEPTTPVVAVVVVVPPVLCLDTSGVIISMMHDMTNGIDNIDSYLTLSTSCDTVEVVRNRTLNEITYFKGMTIFFDRNELTK